MVIADKWLLTLIWKRMCLVKPWYWYSQLSSSGLRDDHIDACQSDPKRPGRLGYGRLRVTQECGEGVDIDEISEPSRLMTYWPLIPRGGNFPEGTKITLWNWRGSIGCASQALVYVTGGWGFASPRVSYGSPPPSHHHPPTLVQAFPCHHPSSHYQSIRRDPFPNSSNGTPAITTWQRAYPPTTTTIAESLLYRLVHSASGSYLINKIPSHNPGKLSLPPQLSPF